MSLVVVEVVMISGHCASLQVNGNSASRGFRFYYDDHLRVIIIIVMHNPAIFGWLVS